MSLINCPECSKEISDRGKSCPHCGYPLAKESVGSPTPETSPGSPIRNEGRNKKSYFVIGALIMIIAIAIGGYAYYEAQQTKAYAKEFDLTIVEMVSGGSRAEELSKDIVTVWYNSIWNPSDPLISKYAVIIGHDVIPMEAVNCFLEESNTIARVQNIEDSKVNVEDMIKHLNNPPSEYKTSYATLLKLHGAYLELTDVAINPIIKSDMGYYDWNYWHYKDRRSQRIDNFVDIHEKLKVQLPN